MHGLAFVLISLAAQQVLGQVEKPQTQTPVTEKQEEKAPETQTQTPVTEKKEEKAPETQTHVTALAELLKARNPEAGFSSAGIGAPSTNGQSRVGESHPQGPKMVINKYEPYEPEPAPWIPSWLDQEEKADERIKAAEGWEKPEPPPKPWISPLLSDEEKEEELSAYNKYCEDLKNAPPPSWVTDWIARGGMDAPTPPPWVPPWSRDPVGAEDPRDPPPWVPDPPAPPPPAPADGSPAPFIRPKRKYKGSAYPAWEPQPKPWIPSWLDPEEQAEQKWEEALKYKPPDPPDEPWLSPVADDEARAKTIQDHRTKVIEMGQPPVPQWVTDWLEMGGEVTPAPPPWKPSWQRDPGEEVAAASAPAANPASSSWPLATPGAPLTFTSETAANVDNVGAVFKEGDKLEFKVSDMTKKDGKISIKFSGPFEFTAEGDLKDKE